MIAYLSRNARQFQGRTFRRNALSRWSGDRRYFKPTLADMRAGVRALHVEVFKHHRGPIPAGFQVHHVAGNTNRNRFRDLRLVARAAHHTIHRPVDQAAVRAHLARIRPHKGTGFYERALATRARRRKSRRRRRMA